MTVSITIIVRFCVVIIISAISSMFTIIAEVPLGLAEEEAPRGGLQGRAARVPKKKTNQITTSNTYE